uniref:Uncharacterized protein n=1 Tax=Anopheles culicifacies TaxID=139723 RepID=A0A182MI82_9DIPT
MYAGLGDRSLVRSGDSSCGVVGCCCCLTHTSPGADSCRICFLVESAFRSHRSPKRGGEDAPVVGAVVESGVSGFCTTVTSVSQMSGEFSRVPVLPEAVVSADGAAGGRRIGMKADLTTSICSSSDSSSLADERSPLLVSFPILLLLTPGTEPAGSCGDWPRLGCGPSTVSRG